MSNGAGSIFVGRTNAGLLQRGLLTFDIAWIVPAGATIQSVTLSMYAAKTSVGNSTIELHQVLADWGEAGSLATGGSGTQAMTGDATWMYRFYADPAQTWNSAGGDMAAAVSSAQAVGSAGASYTWSSTTQMVADVQGWLNNPSTNFGWS